MTLTVCTFVVSPFAQNARIIADFQTKKALLIDPGDDVQKILNWVCDRNLTVESILLTHCHIDHAGGVKALLKLMQTRGLPCPKLYYHEFEQVIGNHIQAYAKSCGFPDGMFENVPKAHSYLDVSKSFNFSNRCLDILFVPGHSPGHVALYFESESWCFEGDLTIKNCVDTPLLIAGDTLFKGSIGRTDLPGGNHQQLLSSISTQLFCLPDHCLVLSGHGPHTSIGFEKKHNPFFNRV